MREQLFPSPVEMMPISLITYHRESKKTHPDITSGLAAGPISSVSQLGLQLLIIFGINCYYDFIDYYFNLSFSSENVTNATQFPKTQRGHLQKYIFKIYQQSKPEDSSIYNMIENREKQQFILEAATRECFNV